MVTDPRERLVQVGNALLDTIYQEEALDEYRDRLIAAASMPEGDERLEEAKALLTGDGLEKSVNPLTIQSKRRELTREYVTIRQTIEALIGAPAGDPR